MNGNREEQGRTIGIHLKWKFKEGDVETVAPSDGGHGTFRTQRLP